MWIQHPKLGAFSIVLADDLASGKPDPEVVMIRARREEHLRLLQGACPSLAAQEVIKSPPGHDYAWRIVAPKGALVEALAALGGGLDYRNVKGAAHKAEDAVGRRFVDALHQIWTTLHGIQVDR